MTNSVEIKVVQSDVVEVDVDLLLLKYARRFYGADELVAYRLQQSKVAREGRIDPRIGEAVAFETQNVIAARKVMFLGCPRLSKFRYKQMREYAYRAIELIGNEHPEVSTFATTVHGAGYGLDIEESLQALVFGFQQAFSAGVAPNINEITFVERNSRRFEIVERSVRQMLSIQKPTKLLEQNEEPNPLMVKRGRQAKAKPVDTGDKSPGNRPIPLDKEPAKKKLVFVAMPFSQEFEDVYQFGIYDVVRRCGLVCERVDESYYAGNIVERIKEGIESAEFVIADLTTERPNVYLEVGYAWGLQRPVILIAREGQNLHFDLAQHKCIFYPTIVKLADKLESTIRDMFLKDQG